jgi:hypothetical protein
VRWFILGLRRKPGSQRLKDHLQAALQAFLLAYGNEVVKLPAGLLEQKANH